MCIREDFRSENLFVSSCKQKLKEALPSWTILPSKNSMTEKVSCPCAKIRKAKTLFAHVSKNSFAIFARAPLVSSLTIATANRTSTVNKHKQQQHDTMAALAIPRKTSTAIVLHFLVVSTEDKSPCDRFKREALRPPGKTASVLLSIIV